eukprot:TRINITY_DN97660_c0_g1_i1.p1 TRINITY_DN97660_c0_g1~~TRINITY_DN97660_c0_g1_i1.p1  ORF type:complete len:303 (-),score=90.04 TRINITY_DN97660_c0_g1_i1:90-998(-)
MHSAIAEKSFKELSPDEIAALACKEYQAKRESGLVLPGAGGYGVAQPPAAVQTADAGSLSGTVAEAALSREELLAGMAKEAEAQKACRGPMDPAEYRQRQELSLRPEAANTPAAAMLDSEPKRVTPFSYEELMNRYLPHNAQEEGDKAAAAEKAAEVPPTPEQLQRLEILKAMDRSQMPAVSGDSGSLAKTIEHYTFSDTEDFASFSVHLDKDLFEGASKFLQDPSTQVIIDSRATSLEIRLQGIPVSQHKSDVVAEWKLTLSPLFARVEASLTTHKVKGGKISVKLAKSKPGAWKKGVKYS